MLSKGFLSIPVLLFSNMVCAAGVPGDQIISNNQMDSYTVVSGPGYKVPDAWKCTNYPAKNRRCGYTGTKLGLYSTQPGSTVTSVAVSPVNPTWWQTINVPADGTYQLSMRANTYLPNMSASEVSGQALIVKVGTTTIHTQPFQGMPLAGVGIHAPSVSSSVKVALKSGVNTLSIGLLKPYNPGYYGGYWLYVDELSLTYVGP